MLRVEIKLVPHGMECMAKTLGVIEIENDDTGDLRRGNYDVRLTDEGMFTRNGKSHAWKKVRLEDFPRMEKGPYQILLAALLAALPPGER